MSDEQDQGETKGRLSLRPVNRGELGRTVDAGSVRQSFSHGRSKVVQVEVRKKRGGAAGAETGRPSAPSRASGGAAAPRGLTAAEQAARQRAVVEQQREAARLEAERREQEKISILSAAEEARRKAEEEARAAEEAERLRAEEEARRREEEEAERRRAAEASQATAAPPAPAAAASPRAAMPAPTAAPARPGAAPARRTAPVPPATSASETLRLRAARTGRDEEEEASRPARRPGSGAAPSRKPSVPAPKKVGDDRRRGARIDVQAALSGDDERVRSLASVRRQRDRERRQAELERLRSDQVRVVREVVLPETITVQELANRMAARVPEVVKSLMKLGVMATATQTIDADTAELVVEEFGHRSKRVSESDVELGLEGQEDSETDLKVRPPVVTIMGHVDHGKTSLLDALRSTDVAAREAGGITQHIGAYQVTLESGAKMTFIDTPGHEAFTAMRARGASVTDIVILVVAADDGVMPQTVEAIRHAKAANVPIIVAINKIDRPDANPNRVRSELLQYDIAVEAMGGETQDVEVSALKRQGLDALQEAILLQAELLDLKANPNRSAEGAVIESSLDRGRGPVATVLVQKGTLRQGDIVVAGTEQGRVRAMLDDHGQPLKDAGPSTPVEILGLSGVPGAGEVFVVVENEGRAREIAEFRQRKLREHAAAAGAAARGTLDQMLARIQAGEQKEVALVIKADVQGSAEAIQATVQKLGNDEVRVRVLLAGVGQITESDVQLAKASDAIIVAFNVRANAQARTLASRDGVDIRYYSIIYQVSDDIETMVKGKLAPIEREKFLGYAEIRQVFNITKVGKVAGCYVTEGLVKRGAGVRLLREGVVIHQGELSQLKRFKDDVREVARGYECGLSFAGFSDLREGDVVECYETETVPA
ncbi:MULTISPECIES: translation initiation factor IF-2 [Acidiphilium]|uniref:Translation initiation factor IF-2 n=3 Tax=Acidiphilium TaxID=522 RepID=IF2_ACICJ|nr:MULTISPECIES: translation initiation factor IF-2 [Acidiphilium]A5FV21.1 RecName: Full=Translation initiation factor IF-2 [Acidiphilium cryptum JF-5]MBU6356651.1 translation initiation factor IF-2 [Rhodospirillales bacterium]ABQ29453.1 bacterial translation initiation factor 2 (bIF-2) [Acidiphilium cryptum JF-5]KDM66406.1 translation initiation factor IF-2 [Acidiphilium sp. JA12-A1]MBS3024520.1 translation initiation factor IF-2 [Acidiphilium multivorum]UNC13279.1 translation initiation fac